MKKTIITLASVAISITPIFAQLYYPTTGSGSGAVPPSGIANTFFGNFTGNQTTTGVRNSFFGHYSGAQNTIGEQNTFFGCLTGYNNTTGSFNSFFGERAGSSMTTGGANTFTGYLSGSNTVTAYHNTFSGFESGLANTADYNSFYGSLCGRANTTGSNNSFYGFQAGNANTTGSSNTFMGHTAGLYNTASENSFFGTESGGSNTSGYENAFFGLKAGYANTTGYSNTFIGTRAGLYNDGGSYNTYIGGLAGGTTAGDYNTCVGFGALLQNNVNFSTSIGFNATVLTDYTVGLGDPYSGTPITVIIGKDANMGGYSLETNGDIYVNGTFYPSDKQFKKDIENYTNAMDVINKLRPVSYFFKDDVYFPQEKGDGGKPVKRNFAKEEQIGFIAQELEQVLPNMVRTDKNGFKGVNYDQLFGVLTQGIKEQDVNIKEQSVKISLLETQNKELKEQLDAINALLLSQTNNTAPDAAKANAATDAKLNGFISSVTPNPFSAATTISYTIPENYKQANLSVVSESGIQAAKVSIGESGKGSFVFVGETLKPGSYYCYLTVNGVIVDYRKIILAK